MGNIIPSWGGDWTFQKLNTFERYVKAYLTIMNNNRDKYNWKILYFDGFAGSGTRTEEDKENELLSTTNLFGPDVTKDELNVYYKGAAERVVGLELTMRGFDGYYFIDKEKSNCDQLESLLSKYKTKGKKIFLPGDANVMINKFVKAIDGNSKYKILAFLDPFGMQIDWTSIECLFGLSVDLWILVPTGCIVNRLLERNLDKENGFIHAEKLQSFFGMTQEEIISYFYEEKQEQTLFGEEIAVVKSNGAIRKIAELYVEKLGEVFPHVTKPLVLRNTRNVPIFHFVFASRNETAKKIAQDIIDKQ